MAKKELNSRSWQLLRLLIERYISDGQPVASKSLANDLGLSISPATIRNVMADLEHAGYIVSPHTSAGRVPTAQGYRLFVDDLLTIKPVDSNNMEHLRSQLHPNQNTTALLQKASALLSDVTKLAGVVTKPKHNQINLRHIEFLSLSNNRVLTILVFNNREVQNRIIYVDRAYSASELQQAANFINDKYAGKDLLAIRKKLLASMKSDRDTMNELTQTAIDMANKVFRDGVEQKDYMMAGQSHLLDLADTAGLERLRFLFDAFTQKQAILHLLDKSLQTSGVQIFIGKEAGSDVFNDFSVVTAPYEADGEILGVLGVIGPTRMPYDRVISVVDITARLLGAALQD